MPAFYPEKIMQAVNEHLTLDGLVLWTKNPEPFLEYVKDLQNKEIPFYFQYTLNDYRELEPGIPTLESRIKTFQKLSDTIGKERVIWRFDPVLKTETLTIEQVMDRFNNLANQLSAYTETCVFSYVDIYPKILGKGIIPLSLIEMEHVSRTIGNTCFRNNIKAKTCAEVFTVPNIDHNKCIDIDLLNRISGNKLQYNKDTTQRKTCGCAKSIDIGEYHTCKHGCVYCYAN
jgi:hypothetical protein